MGVFMCMYVVGTCVCDGCEFFLTLDPIIIP